MNLNNVNTQYLTDEQLRLILTSLRNGHNLYKRNGDKLSALEIADVNRTAFSNLFDNTPKLQKIINDAKKVGENLPTVLVLDFDIDNFSVETVNLVETIEVNNEVVDLRKSIWEEENISNEI